MIKEGKIKAKNDSGFCTKISYLIVSLLIRSSQPGTRTVGPIGRYSILISQTVTTDQPLWKCWTSLQFLPWIKRNLRSDERGANYNFYQMVYRQLSAFRGRSYYYRTTFSSRRRNAKNLHRTSTRTKDWRLSYEQFVAQENFRVGNGGAKKIASEQNN